MPTLFRGRRRGGLGFDPDEAVEHLARRDKRLGELMTEVGPFHLQPASAHSPFAALGESIVYQQLTGKAAATIVRRLCAAVGGDPFPEPAAIAAASDEVLRAAGLSRGKIAALRDLCLRCADGTVPTMAALRRMEDEAIVKRLTAVRGVGRWTVEMLLIFRLGRPDVLPAGDYGVRKGFMRTYRKRTLPEPSALLAHGERWRPYRTVASWYLWRALEL